MLIVYLARTKYFIRRRSPVRAEISRTEISVFRVMRNSRREMNSTAVRHLVNTLQVFFSKHAEHEPMGKYKPMRLTSRKLSFFSFHYKILKHLSLFHNVCMFFHGSRGVERCIPRKLVVSMRFSALTDYDLSQDVCC